MDEHGVESLDALVERAAADPTWFWDAVIRDLDLRFEHPYTSVMDTSKGVPFTEWCVGGRMNIVQNLLDRWMESEETRSRVALSWEGEDGTTCRYTYGELNERVCNVARQLQSLDIGPGRVAGLFMPMTPELAIAFLAVLKVGAIILPLFSGYGPSAIATRLEDAGASVLFTADGFRRRGKIVPMKETADEALELCPHIEHVFVHRYADRADVPMTDGRDHEWSELERGDGSDPGTATTSAEDVAMIIYTSGTTGKPKGAVHTHCGFPVKAAQDMYHAMDVKPGDVVYWMTDMGWMMGPWLVFGSLVIGSTMVFYDGAPDTPDAGRVWQLLQRHGVTHFGLSPVLVRVLMPNGPAPVERCDLSALRAVCSTGSPWDPESWNWVFRHVLDGRKPILNYSGGTEISGGIVCGNFFRPLKPCSFSGPVPGMDADVVDEAGHPIREQVGELIIRGPWIGMTRGFWNDRQRYLDSYWSRLEGVWMHGDFAAIDKDGLWYILGRSDDTIKVAGKRVGPAEIESIVNALDDVLESAAIGIPHDVKGQEIGIYCVPSKGHASTEALRRNIIDTVASELGKPLRPRFVKFCSQLPKTRNAKIMRRVIKAIHLDEPPGDVSSMEDPAAMDAIRSAH
ncbi:MAG: AMP-dependent synthetase [Bacteroidetes bacterium CG12_big_fil_rev_8_21_14_0_65_60_17]|nr:MAG: AMP-dependent synthetase [Bacteroidetes bacterium CG12_big_fil_rev_8_21_14_0_65_60_17]